MRHKPSPIHLGVQDLCRKLKLQLEELGARSPDEPAREAEANRVRDERRELMERLKKQLANLSR